MYMKLFEISLKLCGELHFEAALPITRSIKRVERFRDVTMTYNCQIKAINLPTHSLYNKHDYSTLNLDLNSKSCFLR